VEAKEIVKTLKEKGRVKIKEGSGVVLELVSLAHWDQTKDSGDGVFLLFDIFQIRTVSEQFSEVSLDIVEYASKPTIYHTTAGRVLKQGPIVNGQLKFALIRKDEWNRLLFAYSQPLILQYAAGSDSDYVTDVFFPLLSAGLKEMFLSPEGDVKIIKG
jgi:hypothetical protein